MEDFRRVLGHQARSAAQCLQQGTGTTAVLQGDGRDKEGYGLRS